jgi:hypothetical protein
LEEIRDENQENGLLISSVGQKGQLVISSTMLMMPPRRAHRIMST